MNSLLWRELLKIAYESPPLEGTKGWVGLFTYFGFVVSKKILA
jgi:hypothetical protein